MQHPPPYFSPLTMSRRDDYNEMDYAELGKHILLNNMTSHNNAMLYSSSQSRPQPLARSPPAGQRTILRRPRRRPKTRKLRHHASDDMRCNAEPDYGYHTVPSTHPPHREVFNHAPDVGPDIPFGGACSQETQARLYALEVTMVNMLKEIGKFQANIRTLQAEIGDIFATLENRTC